MAQNVNKSDYFSQFKDAPKKDKSDYFNQYKDAPSEDSTPSDTTISKTESFIRGAVQGVTMDFSDEITGAVEGGLNTLLGSGTLAENYAKSRDEARSANKSAQEANTKTYIGGNILGGGATILVPGAGAMGVGRAAAGIIKGTGALAKVTRAAVSAGSTGAVLGAVQGAGASEGDSVGKIASDALKGGGAGAAFGGVLTGAGKILPGVRDSVSNDLFRKVLGVTVGDDAAEVATKYLKDPDARNRIVAAANKDTVKVAKDAIGEVVSSDVTNFRRQAGETGKQLLQGVGEQLEGKRLELSNSFGTTIEKLAGKPGAENVSSTLQSVKNVLDGQSLDVMESIGIKSSTPAADAIREARTILKQALFQGGNPKKGIKDSLSPSDVATLQGRYKELQTAFKSIPDAAQADLLYTKASNYTKAAEKGFFRNDGDGGKEISNAALESYALGKGTAGKTEDLDRIFQRRDSFVKVMKDAGIDITGNPSEAARDAAREVMEYNRLGAGDTTGRSAIPAIIGTAFTTTLGGPVGAMAALLAAAAYNPRMYLRGLAMADNLTNQDRKIMAAIMKALKLEGIEGTEETGRGVLE